MNAFNSCFVRFVNEVSPEFVNSFPFIKPFGSCVFSEHKMWRGRVLKLKSD